MKNFIIIIIIIIIVISMQLAIDTFSPINIITNLITPLTLKNMKIKMCLLNTHSLSEK